MAGVRLTYAVEPDPLDTAGAIRFAADHAGIEETFVVVNGDVLTDVDLGALVDFHRRAEPRPPSPDPGRRSERRSASSPPTSGGRVTAFIEKPPRDEAPTNLINAGIYVLEPSVLDRIPADARVSIERETFPALVEAGTLFALGSDAYWLDTGTPDAYLRAHSRPPGRAPAGTARRRRPSSTRPSGPGVWRIGEVVGGQHRRSPTACSDGAPASAEDATVDRLGGRCTEPSSRKAPSVVDSVLLPGARVASRAHRSRGRSSDRMPSSASGVPSRPLSVVGAGAVTASGTVVDGERVAAGV